MTAAVAGRHRANRNLAELRELIREATQLGATFCLSGSDVLIDGLARLPAALSDRLLPFAGHGWLYGYLGGARRDEPALALIRRLDVAPVLIKTAAELRQVIRRLELDKRVHGGHVGIDIETAAKPGQGMPRPPVNINADGSVSEVQPEPKDRTGLDPHCADIQCLQLYAGGAKCFILRGAALAMALRSHWLRRQHLVIHNAVFETAFIQCHSAGYRLPAGRQPRGRVQCTMQGAGLLLGVEHAVTGGRSLANVARRMLGIEVPKELQISDWAAPCLSPGQLAYAASDAILAWRLWPRIARDLDAKGRADAYELQRRAVPAVAAMQLCGLALDAEEHRRQTTTWARELGEARRQFHEQTGRPPPTKPAEVRTWLADVLPPERVAHWPRTATGELSIAAVYLKRLVDIESARPVLRILAHAKLLQNFGPRLAAFINPATGRIHCDYNLAASKAGRFSASSPNLQQLPNARAPEFKRCIVAAPGNVLIGCDWSQIEMRAAAWISQDRALTRVYAEGRDLHAETAARIAGVAAGDVTPAQRQAAKPVNFGSIYGIGPASLRANAFADYGIEMTEGDARRALDRFFATYAQLDRWRRDHAALCRARGYVLIGCGRVVEAAWEPGGRLTFPQCCNLPIQGVCADAMLRALAITYARLRRAAIRGGIVACVHDELLLEVSGDDAERARALLQEAMTEAFEITFPGAPILGTAKAAIGRHWGDVQ